MSHVFHVFADAFARDTPIITGSILLALAVYQTIDVRLSLKEGENTHQKAIYALTVSMILFQITQALLSRAGLSPKVAVPAVAVLVVLVLGGLTWCIGFCLKKAAGPPALLFFCWILLYVAVSGEDLFGRPDAITISVMCAAILTGLLVAWNNSIIEVWAMSFARAFIVAFTLVYTAEFVFPYFIGLGKRTYFGRRVDSRIVHFPVQSGYENGADDILNFRSCDAVVTCFLRLFIVVILTAVGTYRAYHKNKPLLPVEHHRLMDQQITEEKKNDAATTLQLQAM